MTSPARVDLVPMSEETFASWLAAARRRYRDDLVAAGLESPAGAEAKTAADFDALLPDGAASPRVRLWEARDDGRVVGTACAGPRESMWWIWDIEVDPRLRGRGYGRAILTALEQEVRRLGGERVGLNVFGFNTVAINLYGSLGYEVTSQQMARDLPDDTPR